MASVCILFDSDDPFRHLALGATVWRERSTMIRVFLGPMPELLHDLLAAAIDHEADMSTVSDLAVHEPLAGRVARARADVVILAGGNGETSALGTALLDEFPWLRVLAIQPDGQQAWLHELEPVRTVLGEVTVDAVVATIRARHRLPAEWGR